MVYKVSMAIFLGLFALNFLLSNSALAVVDAIAAGVACVALLANA